MNNLTTTIDALGEIKAKIAELQLQEKALKDALGELSPGAYEGQLFRLSISVSDRETLDLAAVREHVSRQFIAAHTTITTVRTLKVSARTGRKVAA